MTAAGFPVRTVAVLLAGGTGQRLGAGLPKQFRDLAGTPIIERSIATFDSSPDVDDVVVVMVPGFTGEVDRIVERGGYGKVRRVMEGGASRTESTYRAITALTAGLARSWIDDEAGMAAEKYHGEVGDKAGAVTNAVIGAEAGTRRGTGAEDCRVLLHDAVRPLVDHHVIAGCVRALRTHAAVSTVIRCSDTVLAVDGDTVVDAPGRGGLRRAQTPQGFWLSTILSAYEKAMADPGFTATDDAAVVLRYLPDVPIQVVDGSEYNIKVTHPGDIALAETLLRLAAET